MGMSTHVIAFKPADDKWNKMKQVWDACAKAGVPVPDEVDKFFGYTNPDQNGVECSQKQLVECGALREWKSDSGQGFEIIANKLPEDVTVIRFYNSW